MKKTSIARIAVLLAGSLCILICCSPGPGEDEPAIRVQMAVASGNGQQGPSGRVLGQSLVVRVRDAEDQPVSGLDLAFQVVEGGGSIPEGGIRRTDAAGEAAAGWVLGAGYNGIEVRVDSAGYEAAPAYFWAEAENARGVHVIRTVASFRRVDGVLYEMTFHGDYSRGELAAAAGDPPAAPAPRYQCSLFAVFGLAGQFRLGRSFDNPAGWKCLTLLTRSRPNDGYASVAPMRMRDIGFAPGSDFAGMSFASKRRLLHAARFPPDGVNEHGLVMGLANVTPQPYNPDPAKATIHFCLWVRKVLDECRTVDEAVALTRRYNIQSSGSFLDVHAMVGDAEGNSLILEPAAGEMKAIRGQGPFQVMTNSPVFDVPLPVQREQCPRFRLIYDELEAAGGQVGADGCWGILRRVGNVWTEWSAVYGISAASASLAIDFDFDPLFHFFVAGDGMAATRGRLRGQVSILDNCGE